MAPKPYEWVNDVPGLGISGALPPEFWWALAQGLLERLRHTHPKVAEEIHWQITELEISKRNVVQTAEFWINFRDKIAGLTVSPGPVMPNYPLDEETWSEIHINLTGMVSVLRIYLNRGPIAKAVEVVWQGYFDPRLNTDLLLDDPLFGKAEILSEEALRGWVKNDPRRVWASGLTAWGELPWGVKNGPITKGTWRAILGICANCNIAPAEASLDILSKVLGLTPIRIRQKIAQWNRDDHERQASVNQKLKEEWKTRLRAARSYRPASTA